MSAAALPRVGTGTALEKVVEILEDAGCVIIEDFATADTLAGLRADLEPILDDARYCAKGYDGHLTRRVSSLFRRTEHLTPVVTQPLYLGAARAIMQKPSHMWVGRARIEVTPNIQLSATQAIRIDPGQGRQPLHRDDSLHLTAENGATLVIPGSHLWDDETPPAYSDALPAVMPAGSCLIWLGGVYHGGGANRSDRPRVSLTVSLDLGNLRPEENQFLAVPRETALALPEELQRLLGYDVCPPGVGWYEMEDPRLALIEPGVEPALR
ncbi:MAG: phytanoyl-CoA dioxygenase [Catenulispora sp. 13_1_20CM_3_70_7]|nr:MAG: phytanoyl-CoA dioxygenase [Catenulispora sp. 13_1_20CM_3_70_7]